MRKYFGTDGIRGVVGKDLTMGLATKCGLALCQNRENAKIVIGGDTRKSRELLTSAFGTGVMFGGGDIIDIGVCTTPGIAYITRVIGGDYGVVISASHNPPRYNGIKVFDNRGIKLSDTEEEQLEAGFDKFKDDEPQNFGNYIRKRKLVDVYKDYLIRASEVRLDGLKIALDTANGASFKIAPQVFKKLGADVCVINAKDCGDKINDKCGSTSPQSISNYVKSTKADVGFAFDGDADRIIACDETGKIIDGDIIIFMLAKYFKKKKILAKNSVVGTTHTNMGIERALGKMGISLLRSDVGDKYVIEKMEENGLSLGGEKSGHVILKEYATTGDGILTAIKLAEMIKVTNKKMSKLSRVSLYPQYNIDIVSCNKNKILESKKLKNEVDNVRSVLGKFGKVIVRPSGTEPKIRIMVECKNKKLAEHGAKKIAQLITSLNEGDLCAE